MLGGDEPVEQLGQGPASTLAAQRASIDSEMFRQLGPALFGLLLIAVHGERTLHASAADRVVRNHDPTSQTPGRRSLIDP